MPLPTPTVLAAALTIALALAYALVCGRIAHRLTRACHGHPAGPHGEPGEPIHIELRDGRTRRAARWLPAEATDSADGAVILLRGKGGCCHAEAAGPPPELVEALRGCGLSVLVVDPRGARRTYGAREHQSVLGAVDHLLARGVAAGRIGVLGASVGGVAALLAMVREPAIGAVAADSAYADFAVLLAGPRRAASWLPAFMPPGALWFASRLCGVDLGALRPVAAAAALRGRPVLVIHGDDDPVVPVAHALAVAKASQARLWVTSSRRHADSYRDAPTAYSAVVLRFFTHHLSAQPVPLPCDRAPAPRPQVWRPPA